MFNVKYRQMCLMSSTVKRVLCQVPSNVFNVKYRQMCLMSSTVKCV